MIFQKMKKEKLYHEIYDRCKGTRFLWDAEEVEGQNYITQYINYEYI
jgi:hypothetical protein